MKNKLRMRFLAAALSATPILYIAWHYVDTELKWCRFQEDRARVTSEPDLALDQKRILEYFYLTNNFEFELLCRLNPELDIAKKREDGYKNRRHAEFADEDAMYRPLAIDINSNMINKSSLEERLIVDYSESWYHSFELRYFGEQSEVVEHFLRTISSIPSRDFEFAHVRNFYGYLSLIIVYKNVRLQGSIYPEGDNLVALWCLAPNDWHASPDDDAVDVFLDIGQMRTWLINGGIERLSSFNKNGRDYYETQISPAKS